MKHLALYAIIPFALVTLLGTATFAQSSFAADMLQAITVRLELENGTTGRSGLCHGFVQSVRYDVAYVATAKHCVEELNSTPLGSSDLDSTLSVTVTYANGDSGTQRRLFWDRNYDDLVMASTFNRRPASFSSQCPTCVGYNGFSNQQIPVLSILSAGGGPPVVSSGTLISDQYGRYFVALPTSPGTSGSAVLDLRGWLVGIVVSALVNQSAQAGWITQIVPGGLVMGLATYAAQQMEK